MRLLLSFSTEGRSKRLGIAQAFSPASLFHLIENNIWKRCLEDLVAPVWRPSVNCLRVARRMDTIRESRLGSSRTVCNRAGKAERFYNDRWKLLLGIGRLTVRLLPPQQLSLPAFCWHHVAPRVVRFTSCSATLRRGLLIDRAASARDTPCHLS
jgi:hypothetical protein